MFIITELNQEGMQRICKTANQKNAYDFMLEVAIEYCLGKFGFEDFCEDRAQEVFDKTEHKDKEYLTADDIEYFETYTALRDAGLINEYCDYLTESWDCEFEEDSCFIPLDDGYFYEISVMNIDEIPGI